MLYRIQQLKTIKGKILSMLRIVIHLGVDKLWSQALTRPKEQESMRVASCPVTRKVRTHHFLSFFFFLFKTLFIYFKWKLITLQYCGGFCHTLTWISHWYTCVPHPDSLPPPYPSHPSGLFQCTSFQCPVSCIKLNWASISHMLICMLQCYSLKSSYPCLHPQSPKVYSLYMCLFCCLTYRVVITIFLNSIYMC